MFFYRLLLICLVIGNSWFFSSGKDLIDLSGEWQYRLIGAPSSIPGEGDILLPGTLDEQHKSIYNPESDNTTQLRREFSFVGKADYYKEIYIPENWRDKEITLFLERTKPSIVKIDGKTVGNNSRILSPQKYNLTEYLLPGKHILEISINNADSIPPIVARSSHAVSEATQTNWNGILGDLYLEAKNSFNIKQVIFDQTTDPGIFQINIFFNSPAPSNLILITEIDDTIFPSYKIKKGDLSAQISIPIDNMELWSNSHPVLHEVVLKVKNNNEEILDLYSEITGFRIFSYKDKYFTINGNPTFLRGTVNAAIFPDASHTPLDLESWQRYFSVLKNYGINHVRFHSWTPPDAAFKAADQLGIYILSELPIWGELDRDLKNHNRFLKEELKGIMDEYGHHPSFVMFSTGNELWGDLSLMGEYMLDAKKLNPDILATYGTNVYLGMNGEIGEEDFVISAKTGDEVEKSVRGSVSYADSPSGGHFNSTYPNSNSSFTQAASYITKPLISHEVGQYQSYPDFSEIEKYQGNLKPDNLKEFKRRAEEAGTIRKNKDFTNASGKWAAKLYKAEMEMAQRSEGLSGYQLFGLQDYPGQGTSLIGILDPFMENKGYIASEEWVQSANDILLLAGFPKFTFTSKDVVEIPITAINFTENSDTINKIFWKTDFEEGYFNISPLIGKADVGIIRFTIPELSFPQKKSLKLWSENNQVSNQYDFWVYPKKTKEIKNVKVTDNLDVALTLLKKGEKVLLFPDSSTIAEASIDPLFINDFWNYRMYRTICDEMHLTPSPGTLGLLINSQHHAFDSFPTENHTDWQWYPIVKNSRPLIIDRLPKDFDPIVEVIDNVERNFRLALMLECNVGKGKLLILSVDLNKSKNYPEGIWLKQSIMEYMDSKEFKPKLTLTENQVINLLTKPSTARRIKELKNETYRSFLD